jgi:hypothetical protein
MFSRMRRQVELVVPGMLAQATDEDPLRLRLSGDVRLKWIRLADGLTWKLMPSLGGEGLAVGMVIHSTGFDGQVGRDERQGIHIDADLCAMSSSAS